MPKFASRSLVVLCLTALALASALPVLGQSPSTSATGSRSIIGLDESPYEVVYLGRTFDGTNTTFAYRVTVTDDPELSHFIVEIPECDPPLEVVGYDPTTAVTIGLDPTTGLVGIKWDLPLGVGQTRDYSVSFAGEVSEGLTGVAVKGGQIIALGERPGPACDASPGQEGCSAAFWKRHCRQWVGYTCCSRVGEVFTLPAPLANLNGVTLHWALRAGDGPGVPGAAKTLLREGVAALLNAAHPEVAYPMSEAEVIAAVDQALATMSRPAMLVAAAELAQLNALACPLTCGGGCCGGGHHGGGGH